MLSMVGGYTELGFQYKLIHISIELMHHVIIVSFCLRIDIGVVEHSRIMRPKVLLCPPDLVLLFLIYRDTINIGYIPRITAIE